MQILKGFANHGGWDFVVRVDYRMIVELWSYNFWVTLYLYYDLISKWSLSFIKRCLASENDLVSFVSHYSVLYGGMSSILGRDVISCSRHYQLPVNYLLREQFNATFIDKICTSRSVGLFLSRIHNPCRCSNLLCWSEVLMYYFHSGYSLWSYWCHDSWTV